MRMKVYNSFIEMYNELPPPPEQITNPPAHVRQIDSPSLSDVTSLFSYTKRSPNSYTDAELFRLVGDKVKRGLKRAGYEVADTAKIIGRLVLESAFSALIGRQEEYAEWKASTLMHPEWSDEERTIEWDRICYESDLRKEEESSVE